MGTSQPPFMYSAEPRNDSRFPGTTFDPKAVTRASWEPKPRKPQPSGPLISFNRHPDAHLVLSHQPNHYLPLAPRTKKWIKWLRHLQLALRALQLNGAVGVLTLMILITNVGPATAWAVRVAAGIATVHCFYAIYHLSRAASGRTPASSAAYQVFAAIVDLCVMSIYAFGTFSAHKSAASWTTLLSDQQLTRYFVPVVYYTMVGSGAMHLISLSISLWLGLVFRRISLMPPDMNPLEDRLTARPFHKRNKSSITTASRAEDDERLSTPLEARRGSRLPYEHDSRPPSVPFMHTRAGSSHSAGSRDSRAELPNRQYQIVPGNSPRNSACSLQDKRVSVPRSSHHGSYTELPLREPDSPQRSLTSNDVSQARAGRFTETWMPTDSLISRTNHRNRGAMTGGRAPASQPYSALSQRYNFEDSSDSEFEDENAAAEGGSRPQASGDMHPNPLRSHPPPSCPRENPVRSKTPFYPRNGAIRPEHSPLSEMGSNVRRVSNSKDIADQALGRQGPWQRQRNISIQADDNFYSRPYGELKCATPPVMVGDDRKVSSGIDYEPKYSSSPAYERRSVSGKQAEEGRATNRISQRGFLA
ncbi:Uncharacterized protein TCAP_06629 [Tolypocladium capitatum]|uniref:Uncharacterized protein n=1 Tax=Tolypocladium capitatum TaxID=45235 RepID=A0A2K3Q798_9HYPO|nr:Uncharacterized protein TCAP_06629 [Tolypocladium capitatum]